MTARADARNRTSVSRWLLASIVNADKALAALRSRAESRAHCGRPRPAIARGRRRLPLDAGKTKLPLARDRVASDTSDFSVPASGACPCPRR
jgi:hypothetical protein